MKAHFLKLWLSLPSLAAIVALYEFVAAHVWPHLPNVSIWLLRVCRIPVAITALLLLLGTTLFLSSLAILLFRNYKLQRTTEAQKWQIGAMGKAIINHNLKNSKKRAT